MHSEQAQDFTKKVIEEMPDVGQKKPPETLKREQLVLDWRKYQRSRAAVRLTIERTLDQLPPTYTIDVWQTTCDTVYQHIYDKYYGAGRSVYALAA